MTAARFRLSAACLFAILVAGCANQNSIFRQNVARGSDPVIFTVDAKQRHMIVSRTGEGLKVCAEAAPDVFSALSTSAAADLGFGQGGTETQARAQAAIAIAEAAGTIERTQTINLLRESLYRTCERYLGGLIDQDELAIQAGRDWRAMIAVLAIEQLTRTARPPSTILIAGGTTASVSTPSEFASGMSVAKSEQATARRELAALNVAAAETCPTEDGEGKTACEKRKGDATAAKPNAEVRLAQADQDVKDWLTLAQSGGAQSVQSAGTTPAGQSQPGGFQNPGSASDIGQVANVIGGIVSMAMQSDEMRLFCIKRLNKEGLTPGSPLEERCLTLLAAAADVETNQLKAAQEEQSAFVNRTFERFWARVSTTGTTADPSAVQSLVGNYINSQAVLPPPILDRLTALSMATDRATSLQIFRSLPAHHRAALGPEGN